MKKRSFENGIQVYWDATCLDLFSACPRKYYYKIVRGIAAKSTSVHLLFGGIYAKALENFYKYRVEGDSIADAQRKVVREAMIASWDAEKGQPLNFEDTKKTRPNLIRTIIWYIEQFAIETEDGLQTYILKSGKPAVELSFSIEIAPEIVYCGHLDRVVTMDDKLYVMDQKTTGGTVGPYYFSTFSPNNQMSGYTFAGQAILHSPISGVIIDAAQIAVNFTRFERGITTRTKDQIEEWLEATIDTITRAQEFTRKDFFPQNPTACGNYSGCEFRELCGRSAVIRENFIKSDFVTYEWDPIKER